MKIRKIRLEVREAVLCATINSKIPDFQSLDSLAKIKEIKSSTPRRVLELFKQFKQLDDSVIHAMLKKNPNIISHIGRPTIKQLKHVLDTHPQALNKLPRALRSEDLVIQAIRPEKKYLFGSKSDRANRVIKNVIALHPNTTFTPRVHHEIIRLMHGAPTKIIKKLVSTFKKQKRELPEEMLRMVTSMKEQAESLNISISFDKSKSIVRVTNYPYTLTVEYPESKGTTYEYYIGDPILYKQALGHQFNPGDFSKFVKAHNFSMKKLKPMSLMK